MKLYALSRPLPRGRAVIALIAGGNGFFKFDTFAHVGYLGISPTGFKATTVTAQVVADIVDASAPSEVGSLSKRIQSVAMSITNVTAIEYTQKGDTSEIVIEPVERSNLDFVLFVDISGR